MQMNLFEDVDARAEAVEDLLLVIVRSDSTRGAIRSHIMNNDRGALIKAFDESIRTFGFGFPGGYSWGWGILSHDETEEEYKVTARELADMALRIYRQLNAKD